ncbi:adenine phosphoribosyltransferase, putative [Babesia ovata]|uniref:Adenine phosphoribosyltransferase, putative n=1 Tax=Babesia ovata TaxID=189622 RepID=A0A2H6K6I9_9APIC|nr:adenine phosphoribosyltransferase, putative [Babesia ovata]GBE58600.1 adenine phosphoribosyltransferase, putative [Babesia ovata]
MSHASAEVLRLLRESHTRRLVANLTEERLQRRSRKSKTIQTGRDAYGKLLGRLFEAGYFQQFGIDDARLLEMLQERDLIDDAMVHVAQGLNLPSHLGSAAFFLIFGWITCQMKLSDIDLYDIITCYSLAPSDDGRLAQIIRHLVLIVIDLTVLKLQAEGCREKFDRDLQFFLQNGTASGIYGRLHTLMQCGTMMYEGSSDAIIANTIAMELPSMPRSRQIALTRVLRHVTDNVLGRANRNHIGISQRDSAHLWRLIVKGIEESGVNDLAYDDKALLLSIRALGKQFDISVIARVLSQDVFSHYNDVHDYHRNVDLGGALVAMRKHGIAFEFPDTFPMAEGNLATVIMDRHLF